MPHSFSHRIGVLSGIFLTALLPLSAASKGTINIGHVTTLTGPNSYIGPGAVAALEDEAARVNAAGGINGWNIKIISYDGQSQPAESVIVTKRLIDQDKVMAIVGITGSGPGIPIARIVDRPGLYISAGRWSPDHRWILFCGAQNHKKTVYLVPVTADGTATASQLVPVSDPGYDAWEPAWSPDGKHVYFVADTDGFGCIWGRDIQPATGRPSGSLFPVAHFHQLREVVHGPTAQLGGIGLSVSRQFLVFSVRETTGEVWLHAAYPTDRK